MTAWRHLSITRQSSKTYQTSRIAILFCIRFAQFSNIYISTISQPIYSRFQHNNLLFPVYKIVPNRSKYPEILNSAHWNSL